MPTKKKLKRTASRRVEQPKQPNMFKMFLSSFSMPAFLLTITIGFTAICGAGFALYKTAPAPDYESWPYVEVRIATHIDQTLDVVEQPTDAEAQKVITATDEGMPSPPDGDSANSSIGDSTSEGKQPDKTTITSSTAEYGTEEENKYKVDLTHDESLYGSIDNGITVPQRNNGNTVFSAYKAPLFEELKSRSYKGMVSLVMIDYGLSEELTKQAGQAFENLHVTYAMSPYAINPQNKIDQARLNGHEVWLSLPLQPTRFPWEETGPMTLLIKSKANENRRRLIWLLSLAKGYTGLMDTKESYFINSETEISNLFTALHEHGVGYITSNDKHNKLAHSVAKMNKVSFESNDLWLTYSERIDELESNLRKLETMALQKEHASSPIIAFFHPYPNVIKRVSEWANNRAKNQGLIFVPASYNMPDYQ